MVSWAQNTAQFQLTDQESKMLLIGATYTYGDQIGTSDQDGNISFDYIQNTIMEISYLGYGSWYMNDETIKNAISTGIATRSAISQELHPVTVISLRP